MQLWNLWMYLTKLFTLQDDGEEREDKGPKERSKLHRRDTPHYLKNKRIHEPIDKEKAMALIASALKKQEQSHPLTSDQNPSDEEDRLPTPPPLPANGQVIELFTPHLLLSISFFLYFIVI